MLSLIVVLLANNLLLRKFLLMRLPKKFYFPSSPALPISDALDYGNASEYERRLIKEMHQMQLRIGNNIAYWKQHTLLGDLRSSTGLILDGFSFPSSPALHISGAKRKCSVEYYSFWHLQVVALANQKLLGLNPAECYHYLFDASIKMHQLGFDWSSIWHGPLSSGGVYRCLNNGRAMRKETMVEFVDA
ncbi:hypothetical protein POM88_030749 [Heracleum sosnowskyi]|uniref:Uncharacterized protein n=1 Tax=Heracleum sosnowskyi TaxID=360622 RepID=A0AAD8HWH7_9APIA|nr:hypothetical protein POM88_030749 [Heracleum sosnowskyi]